MSLLSTLEQTIKLYKAEQAKINRSIQLYREILQTLTPQPKPEGSECVDNSTPDTHTSPEEKEDIELLERALEKALQVRTALEVSEKDPKRSKQAGPRTQPGAASALCKDVIESSAPCKRSQTTIGSKPPSLDRKLPKKPGSSTLASKPSDRCNSGQSKPINKRKGIQNHPVSSVRGVQHPAEGNLQQAGSAHASLSHIATFHSKNTTIRSKGVDKLGKDVTISSSERGPHSHTDESGAQSLLQQNWKHSEQIEKWKSLRMKQSRWPKLWDKVIALQKKPVPERSHFIERMRSTFPKDWPSGSPDQIRALVDRLTHQGHDLTQLCQTKELLAKHAPEVTAELGEKNVFDCDQALESLQMTPDEIQDCAHKAKEEWEAWDRWKPEGGCLCPTGANSMWGVEAIAPLPPTVTYTREEELIELENLRMRVALLQQQIHLEQALSDALSPQLSSILTGPECPKSSVLRDLYSLLGEGGERFASIVLDSDPD